MSEVDEVPRDLAEHLGEPGDDPIVDEIAPDDLAIDDEATDRDPVLTDEPVVTDEPVSIEAPESVITEDPVVSDEPVFTDELVSTDDAATEEAVPTEDEALGFTMPPPMSQMAFVDVVMVLPSTHPVVVLQEAEFPYRELRIPIGGPEGIAIGYASRQVATPRPLTHELMTKLLESFGLTLDVVRITGLQGGVFTAEISVSGPTGQRVLDCRPSDAIALALRHPMHVPIMADADVLDRAAAAAAGQN